MCDYCSYADTDTQKPFSIIYYYDGMCKPINRYKVFVSDVIVLPIGKTENILCPREQSTFVTRSAKKGLIK